MISNNITSNSPSFQGVFRIPKAQTDKMYSSNVRNNILEIGCIHHKLDGRVYVTCGDKKDSMMRATLKKLGLKFQQRKFRSDTYVPGALDKYFVKKK